MPELPEVEVLVRHLDPLLARRRIQRVKVRRAKVIRPGTARAFAAALRAATFQGVSRRGKYLLFRLRSPRRAAAFCLVGHLGMTGRMYLQQGVARLPKHAAVVFEFGTTRLVYEDTRYFGRLTLDAGVLQQLGPEPLGPDFTVGYFVSALNRSRQAIKVRLLDQALVAGVGNIYASEALYVARISPCRPACQLVPGEVRCLRLAIRRVLSEAIAWGSTVPLSFARNDTRDPLFYYGRATGAPDNYEERLRVYDRAGQGCPRCGTTIRRMVQAGRSTFFCPTCQRR